jgi:hypothetical protein
MLFHSLHLLFCLANKLNGPIMNGSAMIEQASKLLDLSQRLDIGLLDTVVACMYNGHGQQVTLIYVLTKD